ncbi:DUF819 domain-containing protein [Gaoshiqia sp. Z1-71]|uniref:DUF819 family protein n=1 Tax=Gaoshiqia hydrogeniformans TaxID=3290090 RepID=UPI003BF7E9F0
MTSLISSENHLALFAVLLGASALGIWSEHKKWLGKVSGIVVTMLLMSGLSMSGFVPVASGADARVPVYELVFDWFIPLSVPMLLLGSNLGRIIREGGKLLVAYLIGAAGVVLGCLLAYALIDLGADSGSAAGVIASTLIGGSMNFVATGEILNFSTHPLFTATIAVDNFAANLFVLLLIAVPSIPFLQRFFARTKPENQEMATKPESVCTPVTMERIALSVFLAAVIAGAGIFANGLLQHLFAVKMNMSILVITVLSVLVANLFPKRLKFLEDTAFAVGLWMMYIFLATIGAATNLQDILHVGPWVLGFYLLVLLIHFLVLLVTAKLFRLDVYEVIVSSAANIMGPSVAAPMAASLGQKKLITPGILVGILGYVIGTFVGVTIALLLS